MTTSDATARRVTSVTTNEAGYVTRVWNDDDEWPSQSAQEALIDIELGIHSYFVRWPEKNGEIEVTEDAGGRYLCVFRRGDSQNALLELPRHDASVENSTGKPANG